MELCSTEMWNRISSHTISKAIMAKRHFTFRKFQVCSIFWGEAHISGQITIIPKPELRGFWGDSLTKPPFGVTSAEVVINCPDISIFFFRTCNLMNLCSWKPSFQYLPVVLSIHQPKKNATENCFLNASSTD